jgi:hydrogenase maturation protein HypF
VFFICILLTFIFLFSAQINIIDFIQIIILSFMEGEVAFRITVKGLVQGVGFRPFVYRLALKHGLRGWVVNRNDAVVIKAEGKPSSIPRFVEELRFNAPVVAQVDEIQVDNDFPDKPEDFRILASQDLSDETSEICPDIAVCPDCLSDINRQVHRKNYPFVNCTHCGPRFSIIFDFPYDRARTTMEGFVMCSDCRAEYENIADRRFHAQPVACNACGPHYTLHRHEGKEENFSGILTQLCSLTDKGSIVAVKGTGGYHLMCDALNEKAVSRLREAKKREGKPFAVMFRDLAAIREYAEVSPEEESMLTSWKRPIVLLKMKKEPSPRICLGLDTIGCFLPFMPLHHLLFEGLRTPVVVLTSGNLTDEPVVTGDKQAMSTLGPIADAVLTYNRDIFNRTDDSVVRLIQGKERLFRRSRGYAPSPLRLPFDVNGILATGAELSSCFCIGKDNKAIMSQHIGDLKNLETYEFYVETIERFKKMFRIRPVLMAADMHPDYLSTRYAEEQGLEIIRVQHHHAHVAACMAEYGIDDPVIGVCFDGTGYGTDGHTWGSEFMIARPDGFERYAHFNYLPLPGGDKATGETWRTGLSLLYNAYGSDLQYLDIPFVRNLDKKLMAQVMEALEKRINTPLSSGCGRLFDGIAAITGLCSRALFHAEAPMRLESVLDPGIGDHYPVETGRIINFREMIRKVVEDIRNRVPAPVISARFHNSIIWAIFETVRKMRHDTGISRIVLAGGTFQNKYLTERTINLLTGEGAEVFLAEKIPFNDGGIALGQLVIAARTKLNLNS